MKLSTVNNSCYYFQN